MKELFIRMQGSKALAGEILVASLFVNLLFLASPIFVIQILSRYIGYGFDGTLYTLTTGMVIAVVLNVGFSLVRMRMCAALSVEPDMAWQTSVHEALTKVQYMALHSFSRNKIQQLVAAPRVIQAAFESQRVSAVLDMPFYLIFILAIYLISPLLALITLTATVVSMLTAYVNSSHINKVDEALRKESMGHSSSMLSAINSIESVRIHGAGPFLRSLWKNQYAAIGAIRNSVLHSRSWTAALMQGLSALLKVAIYAVGAKLVVSGSLSVGALIGVSILSAKALHISSGFMQAVQIMGKAKAAQELISEFSQLPHERENASHPPDFSGQMALQDISIMFEGQTGPLIESLTLPIPSGSVLGIIGKNGTGKTTLCKMLVGLVEPTRGQLLIGGVDLRQISSDWWRSQIMYVPQEPMFIDGTFRDNIIMSAQDIDTADLDEIIRLADLKRYLDASLRGLDSLVVDGGKTLPVGIRKRLGLARALVGGGKVAIFDEPTDGLDKEGCQAVYTVLNILRKRGVTIVVVSQDPNIIQGYNKIIDLDSKPVPRVAVVKVGSDERHGKAGDA
tara:strand:- start:1694 stop:3382 length:1689 start_codon:yes stop_codon:yes gene_type:complete